MGQGSWSISSSRWADAMESVVGESVCILVVDGEASARTAVGVLMLPEGYALTFAASGGKAL
jgi:hypothetical protein